MEELYLYFDGGCRGNPGRGAWAYVIKDDHDRPRSLAAGEIPVEATNNMAEWIALCKGLPAAAAVMCGETVCLHIMGDSELVIKQLKGEYRTTAEHLRPYLKYCETMLEHFGDWTSTHIGRERNREADELTEKILGKRSK